VIVTTSRSTSASDAVRRYSALHAPRRAASARVSAKLQDAREPVPGNWQRAREMTPAERRSGGGGSSSSQYQRCSRHASSPERSSRNNDATTTATAR